MRSFFVCIDDVTTGIGVDCCCILALAVSFVLLLLGIVVVVVVVVVAEDSIRFGAASTSVATSLVDAMAPE